MNQEEEKPQPSSLIVETNLVLIPDLKPTNLNLDNEITRSVTPRDLSALAHTA